MMFCRVLFVLLGALLLVHNSQGATNCSFPSCFHLRINNCLPTIMGFIQCRDVLGKWVSKPTTIRSMNYTIVEIFPVGLFSPTIGNCTWHYKNANGTWLAFADWTFAEFGTQAFGAGTADAKNNEITEIGNYPNGNVCVWFRYGSMAWDDCYVGTNDTECVPSEKNGPELHNSNAKNIARKV